MITIMKKYWFVLLQDTFIWVKGDKGVVYKSINELTFLHFRNEGKVAELVACLLDIINLNKVEISSLDLYDTDLSRWVSNLVNSKCAKLIEITSHIELPMTLKPVLKIQDDLNFYKTTNKKNKDGDIMQNLLRLIIHLNGSDFGSDNFAKQVLFPFEKKGQNLDLLRLKKLMMSMGYPYFLSDIILIGNVWEYHSYKEVMIFCSQLKIPVSIYCTEEDFMQNTFQLHEAENISYTIIKNKFTIDIHDYSGINLSYHFLIASEQDLFDSSKFIDDNALTQYKMYPIFSGDNLDFFREHIYLSEEEIQSISLSKREIFARQTININDFGSLILTPDGLVYSNLNDDVLGSINESLYTLVYREITQRRTWLNYRNCKPCIDCIYQYLCPSPSNYEKILEKPNLCTVKR